jgi:hypothetical protein
LASHRFDVLGEGWVSEAPLTTKRARFGAAILNDIVCVVRNTAADKRLAAANMEKEL